MNKPIKDSSWDEIVNYINSKDVGYCFARKELHLNLKDIYKSTIDGYIIRLITVGILEKPERAQYKLIAKIPKKLNTSVLWVMLNGDRGWQKWFIPIEERIERAYRTAYPNKPEV